MSTATTSRNDIALEQTSGNFALIDTLRKWGVTFFSGVNGGGFPRFGAASHWLLAFISPFSSRCSGRWRPTLRRIIYGRRCTRVKFNTRLA